MIKKTKINACRLENISYRQMVFEKIKFNYKDFFRTFNKNQPYEYFFLFKRLPSQVKKKEKNFS
jgi:hypothetical protein